MFSDEPQLALRDVSRRFGEQVILDRLSLDVRPGETLAIIGESGCGKSLTLKLLMGLLAASSGSVYWDGEDVDEMPRRQRAERQLRFGYLFQGAALFDSLSVFENVAFGLRQNTRWSEAEISQAVIERLREVGLSEVVCHRKPAELSGGQKKRVALARALVMQPDIMLYDEPTTGLDPIMIDVINELIIQTAGRRSADRAVTSVVVTHEMSTVRKVADRVVMLYPRGLLEPDEPQVVFAGSTEEAFETDDRRVAPFVRGEAGERVRDAALAAV